jgi:hypothetical protein
LETDGRDVHNHARYGVFVVIEGDYQALFLTLGSVLLTSVNKSNQ